MARLRELITAMDGVNVRTLLQSGNAVFEHDVAEPALLAQRLEASIAEGAGLSVPCVVREFDDLRRVLTGNPFAAEDFASFFGDLTARAEHPTLRGIAAAEGNHMFYGQGAVPIFRQGVLVGACGVGGGTAQEDEDCARAGVEKL